MVLHVMDGHFFQRLLAVFARHPVDFVGDGLACFRFANVLAKDRILSAFKDVGAVRFVIPMAGVGGIGWFHALHVVRGNVLGVLYHAWHRNHFLANFFLPLSCRVRPRLCGVRQANGLHASRLCRVYVVNGVVRTLTGVLSVGLAACQVASVVGRVHCGSAFIANGEGEFERVNLVSVVNQPPEAICPVYSHFRSVVLRMVLVRGRGAFFHPFFNGLLRPIPVPYVKAIRVVFTRSFPDDAFSATNGQLFMR